MHIPDGFLSTPVWAAFSAVSLPAVGVLTRRAQSNLEESKVPLMGVMGAFVFAAQMINFPVGAGTSAHLLGSALLAYTLGPAAAAVVMTAILVIQALVFQDGGILALGANIFNMALAGVLAAYLPYRWWGRGRLRRVAIFLGGTLAVAAGALLAIAELLLSGVPMPRAILGLSLGLFLVNALIEGGITLAVVEALERMNPGWVRADARPGRMALAALALAAVLLAAVGVLFASAAPDGLESLAARAGIASQAKALIKTPLADYETSFFESPWLRKATAGIAGLGILTVVSLTLGRLISRRRSS
jgi:cobalt/nickel transport system permease protein